MKNPFLIGITLFISIVTTAQTTATFTINSNEEDATIDNYNPGGNYPNEIEYVSRAWTINNVPTLWRSVFKFDLACIPSNAVIQSASLSLFYATQNGFGNQLHESLTSSNESVVQRITSVWTENTVTWNNQPATTNADEIILPQSVSGTQDYLNMDVTAMVQQMVSTANNGFLIKLTNETFYANMIFASGDNPDSTRHPQLVVTYFVPGINCVTLRMNTGSEDATIDDYNPNGNYPNEIENVGRAWTINGFATTWRSLFKFDFPCSMSGAIVQSAYLSLYYAAQNGFGNQQHESLTSSNESVLQRITSSWTENTVTWNSQPSATSTDEVLLPQSTSGTQDYTNYDVTAMVQQMVSTGNNGFLLRLTNETYYANLIFASGDNPDTARHAKLEICFSIPAGFSEIGAQVGFVIFPNPSNGHLNVENISSVKANMDIVNVFGELIYANFLIEGNQTIIIDTNLSPGIYFVRMKCGGRNEVRKLVIQ